MAGFFMPLKVPGSKIGLSGSGWIGALWIEISEIMILIGHTNGYDIYLLFCRGSTAHAI